MELSGMLKHSRKELLKHTLHVVRSGKAEKSVKESNVTAAGCHHYRHMIALFRLIQRYCCTQDILSFIQHHMVHVLCKQTFTIITMINIIACQHRQQSDTSLFALKGIPNDRRPRGRRECFNCSGNLSHCCRLHVLYEFQKMTWQFFLNSDKDDLGNIVPLQCFDTVGWATGRVSSM